MVIAASALEGRGDRLSRTAGTRRRRTGGFSAAAATGRPRPIPPALAARLLDLPSGLVTGGTRAGLFAPPVPVPPSAGPHERLLAHPGRDPARQARTA